jgi:hypothetical protein
MEPQSRQQALLETAQRIFEDAAFAFVDAPEDSDGENNGGPILTTLVEFQGPFTGRMLLAAPAQLGKMIAANMLGVEEDDPEL